MTKGMNKIGPNCKQGPKSYSCSAFYYREGIWGAERGLGPLSGHAIKIIL